MEFHPVAFLLYFLIFNLGLRVVYPICSLLHELGHGTLALILGKGEVRIHSGSGKGKEFRLGRMVIVLVFSSSFQGFCEFSNQSLSNMKLALITLGGPMVSAVLSALFLWGLMNHGLSLPLRGLLAIFFYANLRIFLTSAIPSYHTAPANIPSGPSDGMRFLEFIRKEP